jgi:uncharacterized protein (DUF58 family)
MALLDRAALRLLERLHLRVRAKATSADQGGHRSDARAHGLEFAERREYVGGDDARKIDWQAFARNRTLSVRTFEEERDARVYVLVDVSASMALGAPPKLELARQVAASFGFLGMNQVDRVQVIPFADSAEKATAPMRRRDDYPALEAFLDGLRAHGSTSFAATTSAFLRSYPARGLVVLVSDLMEAADWSPSLRALAERSGQLCVVRVRCDEDHAPTFRGELELRDAETGDLLRVTVTPALLEAYRAEVAAHVERARDACRRVGARLLDAPVEAPFDQVLRAVIAPALEQR